MSVAVTVVPLMETVAVGVTDTLKELMVEFAPAVKKLVV